MKLEPCIILTLFLNFSNSEPGYFYKVYYKKEVFPDFAVAGARLETILKCWSLKQNAEDLATMVTEYSEPEYAYKHCYYQKLRILMLYKSLLSLQLNQSILTIVKGVWFALAQLFHCTPIKLIKVSFKFFNRDKSELDRGEWSLRQHLTR